MGCWNQTCSITNLPITVWDDIVLIPLIENRGAPQPGLTYYAQDNYDILGLPLYGKYNDYGGIENIETHEANIEFYKDREFFFINSKLDITPEMLSAAINSSCIKSINIMLSNLNEQIIDRKITPDDYKSLEEFINDMIYEDGFLIKHSTAFGDYHRANYMMIHRKLYDKLIEEVGGIIPYKQKETYRDLWIKRIKLFFEKKEEYRKKLVEMYAGDEEMIEIDMEFKFGNPARCLGLVDYSSHGMTYNYFFKKLETDMDEKLLNELVNAILFTYALTSLRKGYLATTGMGSQQEEYYLHKVIAQFVLEHTQKIVNDYKEDNVIDEGTTDDDLLRETAWWDDTFFDRF